MTTLRKVLTVLAVLVVAFFGYGFYLASTPEGKARTLERDVIRECRASLERSGYDATVNALCVRLEMNYRAKWNR